MGEELNQMCNLSDCVEELGIQKGMEKGIEKGREQILMHLIEKKLEKGMSVSGDCGRFVRKRRKLSIG